MKNKKQNTLIFTLGLVALTHAQDSKIDPTGTWIWASPARGGGPGRTNTLVLKCQGNVVTGTFQGVVRGGPTNGIAIADGKMTGDQISFNVTREYNGNSMTIAYDGTVTQENIKGKSTTERDGEKHSRKWEATRVIHLAP
jgi:hypothetical protein